MRRNLLPTVGLLQLQIEKIGNMLIKDVKVLHSRNSLSDLWSWSLSLNSLETKCLLLPDNAFQTKYYINPQNSIQTKCLMQSHYFTLNKAAEKIRDQFFTISRN